MIGTLTSALRRHPVALILGATALSLACYHCYRKWVVSVVKPHQEMTLAEKNGALRTKILAAKTFDTSLEINQEDLENALSQTVGAHRIFDSVFLGGDRVDTENDAFGEKLLIHYLISASINFKNQSMLNSISERHYVGSGSTAPTEEIGENQICNIDNLKPIFETIDKARKQNQNVLVHCAQGIDRSPAVVVAYIVSLFEDITTDQAYTYVRSIRIAANNSGIDAYPKWIEANEVALRSLRKKSDQ